MIINLSKNISFYKKIHVQFIILRFTYYSMSFIKIFHFSGIMQPANFRERCTSTIRRHSWENG